MGSSITTSTTAASPEFLAIFRTEADENGAMPFARFMELALYHPQVGYYRRACPRVGYGPGTDFFTASTSGPLFGELVAAACTKLLGDRDPRAHTFIEIGAETRDGVLAGVPHNFGAVRTVQVGEPLDFRGPCVVFSNELFDAQPCHREVFRGGRWHEIHVRLDGATLTEVTVPSKATRPGVEGYHFDQPLAAAALTEAIAQLPWTGLFVAFDYGKTLRDLTEATPAGTMRAYFQHTQSNHLLAHPGEQDLTCHVCWDWIGDALSRHGFASPTLDSQESFFIRHAEDFIAKTATAEASRLSQRKLALMQLLHPAHLGQKFQVLHALR